MMSEDDDHKGRLQRSIPGGAHTYSRGSDQLPMNAPAALVRGDGAYVWDAHGNRFLDYGMGLRSVTLGYAQRDVTKAVQSACQLGVNLTLPSTLEIEAAERVIDQIPSIEMVKFAKHGSVVATAAVRLARAATGRDTIAVTRQHPFHSFDDWFIGSTPIKRGTSEASRDALAKFDFNDIDSLQQVFAQFPGQIAAVMMEPTTDQLPCPASCAGAHCLSGEVCPDQQTNFLKEVRAVCDQNGALLILDEIITAFRWSEHGAQEMFGVSADLTLLGKALGNGYAISALGGSREIMSLGAIEPKGLERTFLLSSTHGAEMTGLAAAQAVLEFYGSHAVCRHLQMYGVTLATQWAQVAARHGVTDYAVLHGPPCGQTMTFRDANGQASSEFRTLFLQEMIRSGVLMPWVAPSFAHRERELSLTTSALDSTFSIYQRALESDVSRFLDGPPVRPVFRKYN